jgi:hypothetical protein
LNWTKINKNTYECETPYWRFFIETNPNGNNILSTTSDLGHKNMKTVLSIEEDVRQCFYKAFDLNLLTERNKE